MTEAGNFDAHYFDTLYQKDPDPWHFRSSAYEKSKYAETLRALPREHYRHALELGCSIGEFTRRLAARADRVTGVDTSLVALDEARHACAGLDNVELIQAQLPDGDWERPFDLIVLSEILYYLDIAGVERLACRLKDCAPQADMVLVHWTGETNYPLGGDEAVEGFLRSIQATDVTRSRTPHYRLDVVNAPSPNEVRR